MNLGTCAICGTKPADRKTLWEERRLVSACPSCVTQPEPTPPRAQDLDIEVAFARAAKPAGKYATRRGLVRDLVQRYPGRTIGELAVIAGIGNVTTKRRKPTPERRAYDRLVAAAVRARRQRLIRAEGTTPLRYYPVSQATEARP